MRAPRSRPISYEAAARLANAQEPKRAGGRPPKQSFVDAVVVFEVARPAAVRPRTVAFNPGSARARIERTVPGPE